MKTTFSHYVPSRIIHSLRSPTEIEEYGEGKYKVTNALRQRLPQLTAVNPVVQTLEAQVSSVQDEHEQSDTATSEQTDGIPF